MRGAALLSLLRHGSMPWLLGMAFAAFAVADMLALHEALPGLCGALTLGTVAGLTQSSLYATGLSGAMTGWVLMVAGMMPPLVSAPINHVVASSLPRRQLQASILLLAAYTAIWLTAGVVLVPLAIAMMVALRDASFPIVLTLAIVWSCSPVAQRARNRCHRLVGIGLKGWRADRDCMRQGWTLAPWCIVSCWPWMLAAMVGGRWHLAVMAAVTVYLLVDRILPPATVRWRIPPALDMLRVALCELKRLPAT